MGCILVFLETIDKKFINVYKMCSSQRSFNASICHRILRHVIAFWSSQTRGPTQGPTDSNFGPTDSTQLLEDSMSLICKRYFICLTVAFACMLGISSTAAYAQAGSQGKIVVTAADASGAVVPGATLELIEVGTNST